jgi:hypothetical protein
MARSKVKTVRKPRSAAKLRREERITRWSFHIRRDLLALVKEEAQRSGRTYSGVLNDLLSKALQ